jgi:AraC-like DNA-binding protein
VAARRLTIDAGIFPIWRKQAAPALPSWHALLTPVVANAFDDLGVSVALWLTGDYWHAIHTVGDIIRFEPEFGVERRRWDYNRRSFARVHKQKKLLRATHAGFHDVFVPLTDEGDVHAVLVSGPFALSRPTSAELIERWYSLTGTQGRLSDPVFSDYVRATLATLTLDGGMYEAFERLLCCFAELATGREPAAKLAAEASALRAKLGAVRFVESMWSSARGMVSERATQVWSSPDRARNLDDMGLNSLPEHVLVSLLLGRADESDPLDDRLRRDAFQRACVALCRRLGNMVCTPVGDHGIAFLVDHSGSAARTRARLSDVAQRASAIGRRFGFELRSGVSHAADAPALPARYRAALWAAEKALSRGEQLVLSGPRPERSAKHLRALRAELAAGVGERSTSLVLRFDRYVEAVLVHSGYRLGPIRALLEAGVERIAEPLFSSQTLDEKTFDELCAETEEAAETAETVAALVEPYRKLFDEIERAAKAPTLARQDRGTRLALAFIRDHLSERLSLARVARAAGFAPDYFSRTFKRNEGITFEDYTRRLRVERAKQLLDASTLSIEGVRNLCGFSTRSYFHRVFRRAVGLTPVQYRARQVRSRRAEHRKSAHLKAPKDNA